MADEPETHRVVHVPSPPDEPCSNARCDDGWITVGDGYVDRVMPTPPPDLTGVDSDAWLARARPMIAASLYPCKHCRPRTFARWVNRCYLPDHDRWRCDVCGPAQRKPRHDPVEAF